MYLAKPLRMCNDHLYVFKFNLILLERKIFSGLKEQNSSDIAEIFCIDKDKLIVKFGMTDCL